MGKLTGMASSTLRSLLILLQWGRMGWEALGAAYTAASSRCKAGSQEECTTRSRGCGSARRRRWSQLLRPRVRRVPLPPAQLRRRWQR